MLAVRLPEEIERKIEEEARFRKSTKTQIVKEALEMYFQKEAIRPTAFELGKDLFGKYGSGRDDNSICYKKRVKEKIAGKIGR